MSDIFLSVDGDTRPLEAKLNRISSKGINFNLRDGISQPLGRISANVSEFNKSLEASNARVLAFGASAGAVYGITRAFKEMVASTIEVEKSLADINVVLNASSADLSKFGSQLFSIAKNTGQSFSEVAKAATEFSRQGLGIAETLKRTSDALILTRLSGLEAAASVETLTAAVNSFSRAGLTTTEIINKFATVDAAFAVSTADLANALSRVGSSAQDAGVNIDQLIAIVTAAQQNTARGGAVIGNSLKTIFTRLQRTDTLDQLEGVGIAVRDLQGNTLPAIQILKNLSDVFYKLSDSQRASIAETVGGVFQINILKAALGDLTKQYSVYDNALRISSTSTNQAIKRNEALNQTLSALINKTLTNFKQTGATVGEITIAPAIKKGASLLNPILEGFNKEGDSQGIGTKVAKGILSGLGNYLSGPGLALIGGIFLNIFGRLTSFSADALKGLLGISSASDKVAQAQARITSILAQNPSLIQAMISKEMSLLQVENQILQIIQAQNAARSAASRISTNLAPRVVAATEGTAKTNKTKSGGFIPNFSAEMQEILGAQAGGYRPGNIKRMNISGEGNVIYNDAESVVQFQGAKQPAIIPPENSIAGKNYRKQFEKEAGFDPYAAGGLIPNFALNKIPKDMSIEEAIKSKIYSRSQLSQKYGAEKVNKALGPSRIMSGPTREDINLGYTNRVSMIYPAKTGLGRATGVFKDVEENRYRVSFTKSGFNAKTAIRPEDAELKTSLGKNIISFVNNYIAQLSNGKIKGPISSIDQLANSGAFGSIVGTIFETAVTYATQSSLGRAGGQSALIDFASPNKNLRELFNQAPGQYEAKGNDGQDLINDVARKIYQGGFVSSKIQKRAAIKTKSEGFIPNFSALQDAIQREKDAGVDPNRIRVGSDDALVSRNNPLGLGVYNTKDEPGGLKQGIDRAKSKGFIPNFAEADPKKAEAEGRYQSRLLALSLAVSAAQGVISQFGDRTSQTTKTLEQLTLAATSLMTGFGMSKRYGGLIAAPMLYAQAQSMKQESAAAPYNEAIAGLDKSMDNLRSQSSKLDGALAKVSEQTNLYAQELEKAIPDESQVLKLRSNILDAIAPLSKDVQDEVLRQMPTEKMYDKSTPANINNTLTQKSDALTQKRDMQDLVKTLISSAQMTQQKQMTYDSFPMRAIRKISRDKSARPTNNFFEGEGVAEDVGGQVLRNILKDNSKNTAEGLVSLAESLKKNDEDGNAFLKTLEQLSPKTQETTSLFQALNSTFASSPASITKFKDAVLKGMEGILEVTKKKLSEAKKAAEGGPTIDKFQGISKIFKGEDFTTPEGNGKQVLRLMSTAMNVADYGKRGDTLMTGRSSGGLLKELNSLGISSDVVKEFAPDLVGNFEKSSQMEIEATVNEIIAALKTSSAAFRNMSPEKEAQFRERLGGKTGLLSKEGQEKAGVQMVKELFGGVEVDFGTLKTVTNEASKELPQLTEQVKLLENAIKSLREEIEKKKETSFDTEKGKKEGTGLENASTESAKQGKLEANIVEGVAAGSAAIGTYGAAKTVKTVGKKIFGKKEVPPTTESAKKEVPPVIKSAKKEPPILPTKPKPSKLPKMPKNMTGKAMEAYMLYLLGKGLYNNFSNENEEEVPNFAIPNFAKSNLSTLMSLEEMLSGKKAKFDTDPYPHIRNSSQPTYQSAISQHGGLKKALEDSRKNQSFTGIIPNFALSDDGLEALRRMAQEGTGGEATSAKKMFEKFAKKGFGGGTGAGVNLKNIPFLRNIQPLLEGNAFKAITDSYMDRSTLSTLTNVGKAIGANNPAAKAASLNKGFGGKFPIVSSMINTAILGTDEKFRSDELTGVEKLQRAGIGMAGVGLDTLTSLDPTSWLGYAIPDSLKNTDYFKKTFGNEYEGSLKEILNSLGVTRQDKSGIQTVLERADEGKVLGYRGGKLTTPKPNLKSALGMSPIGQVMGITKELGKKFGKPKINPKNYKDSRKPGKSKMPGFGTLMIDDGFGNTQTTLSPSTNRINQELSDRFSKIPMGSYNPPIPEISAKEPSKFEKLKNFYKEAPLIPSEMGGDSRLNAPPIPKELMEGMTDEQQHNAQVMALENIMNEKSSAPGYNPYKNYGTDIAPYKRMIDDLEGGQNARYGEWVPGQGFKKEGGFIGRYEKTRQKQLNKGFSTKEDRLNQQRNTGFIDSGFEKGYANYGLNGKLTPEAQVTKRNYNAETGMIMNQTNEGMVGLESSVLQDEKKIFLDQMGKKYDKKTAQTMLESLTNQKGKDKNGRTGFQNLQAHNRLNSPNIAAPTLKGPEFLKDNIPMYGQNLQAPLLFGTKENTDQTKSLESDEYIASRESFDNTKGFDLNSNRKVESNMPFAQYNNPKEYMPPKDFFQPKTILENQLTEAQNSPLSQTPMGLMQSNTYNQMLPGNNMIFDKLGEKFDFSQGNETDQMQRLFSNPLEGLGNNFKASNNLGNGIANDLTNVLESPKAFSQMFQNNQGNQNNQEQISYGRDPKTGLAISPTNTQLQMQQEPKEKNKEKEPKEDNNISKAFSGLNKELGTFTEKIKEAGEILNKMSKGESKNQEEKGGDKDKNQSSKEVKFSDIKASVTVNSTPDTKTEASIAAIQKVVQELQKELEQLKGKVGNKINPPSVNRG